MARRRKETLETSYNIDFAPLRFGVLRGSNPMPPKFGMRKSWARAPLPQLSDALKAPTARGPSFTRKRSDVQQKPDFFSLG